MSFLVVSALAIAALIAAPLLAHLLRRGRAEEREFPAAGLVPLSPPIARQRTRVEDRLLLSIRAAMILLLALLGATPFVRCSRLALDRTSGASVALAIVVDDSHSMRTKVGGDRRRVEVAIEGARELLDSTREGDAVAIIAAGAPARLLLAATTDLSAARDTLAQLQPSDRDTDLVAATQLARSALARLPHNDKRVVLLSDLAGPPIPKGKIPAIAPLEALHQPSHDCGLAGASVRGSSVDVDVVCTSARAAAKRSVGLRLASPKLGPTLKGTSRPDPPPRLPSLELAELAGQQTLSLELPADPMAWEVTLSGDDDLPENDACPLSPKASALGVGVLSDAARSGTVTGGPTLVEQALAALDADLALQPLAVAPDDPKELDNLRALILDDPPGLSPETRNAIRDWLARGRVAVLFAGPTASRAQLASKLDPFLSAARWETSEVKGFDTASFAWLLSDYAGLDNLNPHGRTALEGAMLPDSEVLTRWSDGRPFIARRSIGRGSAYVVGLPVTASESDFALRPAFLALLQHLLQEAERLGGPARTYAGVTWAFGVEGKLEVTGPTAGGDGALEAELVKPDDGTPATRRVTPTIVGRYRVEQGDEAQLRIVRLSAQELGNAPGGSSEQQALASPESTTASRVDISPQIAIGLLGLLTLELVLRLRSRPREQRKPSRREEPAAAGSN